MELAARDYQVFIFTSATRDKPISYREDALFVYREATRWDSADYQRMLGHICQDQIGLIHLQYHPNSYPNLSAFFRLLRSNPAAQKLKIVVTLHELTGLGSLFALVRLLQLLPLLFRADALILTNNRDKRRLSRIPFLRNKLWLIPLAPSFDVEPLPSVERERLRAQWGIGTNEILLVRFGFVHNIQVSLIPDLIAALSHLLAKGHSVKLLFAGADTAADRTEIDSLARYFGVENSILYTGYRSPKEISHLLQIADIAVQLYPEGVCERRSSLQAVLAHALPLISTKRGIPPPFFVQGRNVLLVPANNPVLLAEAVTRLIRDPVLRRLMSAGTAEVGDRFGWTTTTEATEQLYQTLLTTP